MASSLSPEVILYRLSMAEETQPPVVRNLLRDSAHAIIEIEDENRRLRERLALLLTLIGDQQPELLATIPPGHPVTPSPSATPWSLFLMGGLWITVSALLAWWCHG